MQKKVSRRSWPLHQSADRTNHTPAKRRRHLHLPHAPADQAGSSGQLSDLRHDAGARRGDARAIVESRASRHDAPILVRVLFCNPGCRAWDGKRAFGLEPLYPRAHFDLGSIRACDARCLVGGLAFLRSRLGLVAYASPQHVHADRARDWHRLDLQRLRDAVAASLSAGVSFGTGHRRRLFRGGGRHHRPRPSRPGA